MSSDSDDESQTTKMTLSEAGVQENDEFKVPLNLTDMPPDIFYTIVDKIDFWHHNHIRNTSHKMRELYDGYLVHKFNNAVNKSSSDPHSYNYAALQVVKLTTEVYRHCGYVTEFCQALLPMVRKTHSSDPFNPASRDLVNFLLKFFVSIDECAAEPILANTRLFYNVTLIRIFKRFDRCTITTSTMLESPERMCILVKLDGPYLAISGKYPFRKLPTNSVSLIVMVSLMLIGSIIQKSLARMWDYRSRLHVFGNDMNLDEREQETIFKFTFDGSNEIHSLFRACLEDDADWLPALEKAANCPFTGRLDINCTTPRTSGFSKTYFMEC